MEATKKGEMQAKHTIGRQIREMILFSFVLGQSRLSRDAAKDEISKFYYKVNLSHGANAREAY